MSTPITLCVRCYSAITSQLVGRLRCWHCRQSLCLRCYERDQTCGNVDSGRGKSMASNSPEILDGSHHAAAT